MAFHNPLPRLVVSFSAFFIFTLYSAHTTAATAIATGGHHSCSLSAQVGVQCWGNNWSDQLGNPVFYNGSTVPVSTVGLSAGVAAIATGNWHSCALKSSGGVQCWGSNASGAIGDGMAGSENDRTTPVNTSGLGSGVTAIVAGDEHNCALTNSGGIKCWGKNSDGQIGVGTATPYVSTPVDVTGLTSGVQAIAAGYDHTCALTTTGAVKCWGHNYNGELGDGTTTSRYTPVAVSGLGSGVIKIAVGNNYSCVVMTGGTVKCWGKNLAGELGAGYQAATPVSIAGLSAIADIDVGGSHACALSTAGAVTCWGYNGDGELGNGTTTDSGTPVAVTGLGSGVTRIATGNGFSCAIPANGETKCWGSNTDGQLGDNTAITRLIPVSVVLTDTDSDTVVDNNDNCPLLANNDQTNTDGDSQGNACDMDDDNDGVADNGDAFPLDPVQAGDIDGDGVNGFTDNCPATANANQLDTDSDNTGNNCDSDDDNDGIADITDNCPLNSNSNQLNTDGDSQGDNCDNDDDNDGVLDGVDNCPLNSNADQKNTDGDSLADACDPDDDNDGDPDAADNCPLNSNANQANLDGDSQGDVCDTDDDNDGTLDINDNCPRNSNVTQSDRDADGLGDACDTDDDNDGILDGNDNCPFNSNVDQKNTDADSKGDACDTDDDNDGILDGSDNCPLNSNASQINTDGDSLGDTCDADDDNDALPDIMDPLPLQAKFNQNGTYHGARVQESMSGQP